MAGAGGTDFPVNDEGWPLSPDGYEIIMEVGQVRALPRAAGGAGAAGCTVRVMGVPPPRRGGSRECSANPALWQGWQRSGQAGRCAGLLAQRGQLKFSCWRVQLAAFVDLCGRQAAGASRSAGSRFAEAAPQTPHATREAHTDAGRVTNALDLAAGAAAWSR